MPSFDIVNKVDAQLLDNAINVARKEILNGNWLIFIEQSPLFLPNLS